jgi:hypothetical protein
MAYSRLYGSFVFPWEELIERGVPPVYCPNMAAVRAILCFIHALIVDIAASQLPRIKKDGGWGGGELVRVI